MMTMPVAFLLGQLPALGLLSDLGTVVGHVCLLVASVAASAVRPRRGLERRSMLMLGVALWTILFVSTAVDWPAAVGHRVGWVAMVLAAIAVTRACTDMERTWELVLRPLRNGMVLAVLIVASGAILDRGALRAIQGRFMPWDANPNVLASNLVAALPLFGYTAWQGRRRRWMTLTAVTASLLLITGSRGALLAAAVIAIPFLVHFTRRPVLMLSAAAALVGAGSLFIDINPAATERIEVVSVSSRASIASQYLAVIEQRPWFGLLGTTELRSQTASDVVIGTTEAQRNLHAHNAYLQFAYWGGLALAIPFTVVALLATRSAWKVWSGRRRFAEPMLPGVLAWTVIAVYVHGVNGIMMVFPTYTWAWLGLVGTLLVWRPRSLQMIVAPTETITPAPVQTGVRSG